MQILWSAVVLGGLGLIFGLVLAFASKKFAIPRDPRLDDVIKALPGANCGACGYPGCEACAEAILTGEAPYDKCPVGKQKSADAIAAILEGSKAE